MEKVEVVDRLIIVQQVQEVLQEIIRSEQDLIYLMQQVALVDGMLQMEVAAVVTLQGTVNPKELMMARVNLIVILILVMEVMVQTMIITEVVAVDQVYVS